MYFGPRVRNNLGAGGEAEVTMEGREFAAWREMDRAAARRQIERIVERADRGDCEGFDGEFWEPDDFRLTLMGGLRP